MYDLHESNSWLQHVGLGMYHSGVEIGGVEYTFSEAGIGQHPPRRVAAEGCAYKTTEVCVVRRLARYVSCYVYSMYTSGASNMLKGILVPYDVRWVPGTM